MNGASRVSPQWVHATLRRITECLTHELADSGTSVPDWNAEEWRLARAVAAIHGTSPLLATRLRWEGPAQWQEFIFSQQAHTASRHQRIKDLLARVDELTSREGIPALALKGSELHAIGLYAAGERPMADIDLLVRESDVGRASQQLERLGFMQTEAYWKHITFTQREPRPVHRLGEHAGNDMKIELHTRISEILPARLTDITALTFPQRPHPGLNPYPSLIALMRHLLLHAAGAMAYRSLRMLHLHDLALLSERMRPEDWRLAIDLPDRDCTAWWALPPLRLVARYYPGAIPAFVLDTLRYNCVWWLRQLSEIRTLADVSLSYPYLEAFPGLGWAQNGGEVLEHVAQRLSKATRLLLHRKARKGAPETAPNALSRAPYVLKWFVSRPVRPETLRAVSAALRS